MGLYVGAKTFLETLVNYYADYDVEANNENDITIKSKRGIA